MVKNTEKARSNSLKQYGNNLRYERKFVYDKGNPQQIIDNEVLKSPFFFSEIFHKRRVNNIYFDDNNFSFFKQNVLGVGDREKYRLRWYGQTIEEIKDPTIEVKRRLGEVGDKVSFKLKGMEKNILQPFRNNIELFKGQELPKEIKQRILGLKPSLINSYERRYFLSKCKIFRITIDYNLSFYDVHRPQIKSNLFNINEVILELKYNLDSDNVSKEVSHNLSERLTKSSKYVKGINLIYPSLLI